MVPLKIERHDKSTVTVILMKKDNNHQTTEAEVVSAEVVSTEVISTEVEAVASASVVDVGEREVGSGSERKSGGGGRTRINANDRDQYHGLDYEDSSNKHDTKHNANRAGVKKSNSKIKSNSIGSKSVMSKQ